MVVLAGDLYGTRNHGANYCVYDGMSSCFGSLVFGLLLPSTIYNMHKNSDGDCLKPECFSLTYGIAAMADASAVLVSLILLRLSDRPTPFALLPDSDLADEGSSNTSYDKAEGEDTIVSPLFRAFPASGPVGLPERSLESCELMEEERGSTTDPSGSTHDVSVVLEKKSGTDGAVV
jgi:hypothetical protein